MGGRAGEPGSESLQGEDIYSFSDSFPLQLMTRYWKQFPVLYSRFLFICFMCGMVALVVKNLPANAGDMREAGSIPGSGRSPGKGNDPLQYSCLEDFPWIEEPSGLQSMGSVVGHDWATKVARKLIFFLKKARVGLCHHLSAVISVLLLLQSESEIASPVSSSLS